MSLNNIDNQVLGQGSFGVVYKFDKCVNDTWYNGLDIISVYEISTGKFLSKDELC